MRKKYSVVIFGFLLFFLIYGVSGATTTSTQANDAGINLVWRINQNSTIFPHSFDSIAPVAITEDGNYVLLRGHQIIKSKEGLVLLNGKGEKIWALDPVRNRTLPNFDDIAMSDDGNYIAVITYYESRLPFIFMMDKQGKVLWTDSNDAGEEIGMAPIIDISNDGSYIAAVVNVFDVNTAKNHIWVYLYNKNGQRLWKYDILSNTKVTAGESDYAVMVYNSVAISGDGNLIAAGSSSGHIVLLDQKGKLLWEYQDQRKNPILSMATSNDGSVFVARAGINVYFFNEKGMISNQSLSVPRGSWFDDVSVSQDGNKIAVSEQVFLYFFDGKGNLIWKQQQERTGAGKVTMSSDGSIIAATNGNSVYLYDSAGKILWTHGAGRMAALKLSGNGKYLIVSVDYNPGAFVEYYSIDLASLDQKQKSSDVPPDGKSSKNPNGTRAPGFNFIVTIMVLIIVIFFIKNK